MGFGDHGLASRSPLEIFRDHDAAAPLDLRFLKYGGMPINKEANGRYDLENLGDRAGAVFWEPEPGSDRARAGNLGQWWWGALSVDKPDGLRVLLTDDEADEKLKSKRDTTRDPQQRVTPVLGEYRNTFGHTLPIGTVGTLMQSGSQDEFRQWFLPSLETVAHHNGTVPRGNGSAPECSTRTFDLTPDGALDWDRAGGWHSHIWNAQLPNGGPLGMQGDWVPAWNLARSAGDATGFGAWVSNGPIRGGGNGKQAVFTDGAGSLGAFASHLASGPLHPGEGKGDKHFIGGGETTWNAGHISTKAYFFADKRRDAPLAFEQQPWPYPNQFAIKSKVHLVYHDEPTHEFVGGDRQGLWDWYTTVPVRQPWIDTPGIPKIPTGGPPAIPKDIPVGGGGGGGGGVVTGGGQGEAVAKALEGGQQNAGGGSGDVQDQPNPYQAGQSFDTKKTRIDPARTPYELAMPSLYFFPVRDPAGQPYDGRFGGPPVDAGPQGSGPWSPEGLIARGGGIPIPPSGGSGFPPDFGNSTVPATQGIAGAADGIGTSSETFSGPLGFQNRSADRKKYEADQGVAWTNKPLAFHMQGFAKSSLAGWATNTNPGDEYLSGTVDGGIYISGAEPLLDGTAPDSVSLATMVFASENQLGTRYSGKAARLAFGKADYTTGTVSDGAYLHATGVSGSVNLELHFLDAAGADRAGTWSHYGHFSPGADSTYSQGTGANRWSTVHADNFGGLSSPADAVYTTVLNAAGDATTVGRIVSTRRVTGDTTLDATYDVVFADTDGGVITVTLPAAPTNGRRYTIKNTGGSGNSLTIGRNSININGAASDLTLTDGQVKTLIYQTTEKWQTVNS